MVPACVKKDSLKLSRLGNVDSFDTVKNANNLLNEQNIVIQRWVYTCLWF